jgi:glutaredoxin
MEIAPPCTDTYSIYTKMGCIYCDRAKNALIENRIGFFLVECDDYLKKNKTEFLEEMKTYTHRVYRTFPMVFYKGDFLGGYVELKAHLETEAKLMAASDTLSFHTGF